MELQGTIKKIGEIQTFESGFQKREMILVTEEQYPRSVSIEFIGDRIEILGYVKENQKVKVGINLIGREWTNPKGEVKYFNSIVGWRVEKLEDSKGETQTQKPTTPKQELLEETDDDLPF